jgi:hypothetical protein
MNSNSRLEDLPNELFYKIQSYLTLNDLYKSFSDLNYRFDRLLMSMFNLHYEIRSSVIDQRLTTNCLSSRINNISIPNDSNAVSIATIFSNVRTISFHRSIRLIPKTLSTVERIKFDLSLIRLKQAIPLCTSIFSNQFHSLSSFYILHRKSCFVGRWKVLIYSIRCQCLTLTQFIFDIQPTIEWKTFEYLLEKMPYLQRLIIRKLNTRNQWSLLNLSATLRMHVPHLNYLFLRITTLDTNKVIENNENYHPLFKHIKSKIGNSRKLYLTTIIKSSMD